MYVHTIITVFGDTPIHIYELLIIKLKTIILIEKLMFVNSWVLYAQLSLSESWSI